jgi:hypothetical protein
VTKEERNLALQALQQIAKHEQECGLRWGECINELKNLKAATDAHAERWEKLAWLVIGAVMTTACAALAAIAV